MELLVDIRLYAHGPDFLDIARSRAEAYPVQHMDDGLVVAWWRGGRQCRTWTGYTEQGGGRQPHGQRYFQKA
jgi:hypothetical protein